ncbi:alanine racemase [Actinospica sp. MGRD01-02]|uniref:Multifunctional fusion protein n=1 Tax=Actinospica acidithermotolerans TaxID=2828514 RepID=A0A941EFC5_9ACTN|nr:alanine racemase [Actinospica acidithermotolerans]MBR7829383.1 alanine racemase [Actinospica acidithermotolerans]
MTEAVVDLAALAENLRIFRARTDAALMAVVKADGYGHGAVQIARAALAHGATWLAASFIGEALALRAAGIQAPILTFLHLPDEDVTEALRADLDLTVSSQAQLAEIAACAKRLGRTAEVQLKVDTGLHRNGASPAQWPALVEAAARLEREGSVHVRGIWSHLVHPDQPGHPTTTRQLDLFDEAVREAERAGLTGRLRHIANSTAALTIPRSHYDVIRLGSGLYGIDHAGGNGLVPTMTLRARIAMTRRVDAGEGVSYDHLYQTAEASNLALVPLGYADGLPRAASGSARISVLGEQRSVAGRIAMNSCIVDAGQLDVMPGDEAVVFGTGSRGEPTVADWAAWSGTTPLEILTRVSPRVPRRYITAAEGEVPAARESGHDGKLRVVVLFGGPGGEYDVSCASGATIVSYLDRERYRVQPVRISPEGRWIPGPTDWPAGVFGPHDLVAATPDPAVRSGAGHGQALEVLAAADVVVPALHGPFGEDGTVQALMDALGVRYVGSGMAASVLGMDKDAAKRVLVTSGLRVADWAVLRREVDDLSDADRERLGLPAFVKPARSGSSVGVSRVKNWEELGTALATARKWDEKVLVERSVIGREVDIAVLEHPDGRIEASPPVEIVLHQGGRDFLDYAAKYQDATATDILLPAPIAPEITAELQRMAVQAFEILGCRGLARVDFLLRDGVEPVFNEINTFPGFSATSLYPRMWAEAGIPLPRLLDTMIDTVLAGVPA